MEKGIRGRPIFFFLNEAINSSKERKQRQVMVGNINRNWG